jgi:uncharacterized protein YqjF (DUF2071 family)
MTQTWYSLLFAHWPVPAEALRALLHGDLELDTHGGEAWLGVVPFGMRQVRLRGLPPIPGTSSFLELNVRTYVRERRPRGEARPGVWFLSLDAESALAVAAARAWYHLPYFRAEMGLALEDGAARYRSRRVHAGAPPASFDARYRPVAPVEPAAPGTLDAFLTDRFCLYTTGRRGELLRGEIDHPRWPLRRAEAEFFDNQMARCHGIALPPARPLLHYAEALDVKIWKLRRVES